MGSGPAPARGRDYTHRGAAGAEAMAPLDSGFHVDGSRFRPALPREQAPLWSDR